MIFKTKATLTCTDCGVVKTFDAETDIYSQQAKDSLEIKGWDEKAFELPTLELEGLCPNCKYNKAA